MSLTNSSLDFVVLSEATNSLSVTLVAVILAPQISDLLSVDESKAEQLLAKGRQALIDFQNDIAPTVYTEQMSEDKWFQTFLNEQKLAAPDLYDQILTRTSEYGVKYQKYDPLLSLVVQFIFEFDDETINTLFDGILKTLATFGKEGLKRCVKNLVPAVMEQQLANDSTSLTMALQRYYRQPLEDLLKKSKIPDRHNLFNTALTCVVNSGWCQGLNDPKVRNLVAVNKLTDLKDTLEQYMTENNMAAAEVCPDSSSAKVSTNEALPSVTTTITSTTDKSPVLTHTAAALEPDQTALKQIVAADESAKKKVSTGVTNDKNFG
ncbi:unnamed protein product [Didymodactylos carnosus]|uniref:Uncharacterized protein n=2 Tax=Didymodactylos carnosus TaxID=1234261 RepID=A0A8S2EHE1_9BILA|nr:unnamed protein product [Didymodactylos carnosus]CAF4033881.1 unnamed protein product [Didymodactylos carnosus]